MLMPRRPARTFETSLSRRSSEHRWCKQTVGTTNPWLFNTGDSPPEGSGLWAQGSELRSAEDSRSLLKTAIERAG